MDQSSRAVKRFQVEMEFSDGRCKTIVMNPSNPVTAFYRETESFITGESGRPETIYTEFNLVWSTKYPWIEPEKRGKEEAIDPT